MAHSLAVQAMRIWAVASESAWKVCPAALLKSSFALAKIG